MQKVKNQKYLSMQNTGTVLDLCIQLVRAYHSVSFITAFIATCISFDLSRHNDLSHPWIPCIPIPSFALIPVKLRVHPSIVNLLTLYHKFSRPLPVQRLYHTKIRRSSKTNNRRYIARLTNPTVETDTSIDLSWNIHRALVGIVAFGIDQDSA